MITPAAMFREYCCGYFIFAVSLFVNAILVLATPWLPTYTDGSRMPLDAGDDLLFLHLVVASLLLAAGSIVIGIFALKRCSWAWPTGLVLGLLALGVSVGSFKLFDKIVNAQLLLFHAFVVLAAMLTGAITLARGVQLRNLGFSTRDGRPHVDDTPAARSTR